MLRAKWKIFRKFFYIVRINIAVVVVVVAALHIYLLCEKQKKYICKKRKEKRKKIENRNTREQMDERELPAGQAACYV